MASHAHKIAFDAMRTFRLKEINNLERHLRKFGPLPELPKDVLAKVPEGNPAPFALPNPFLPTKLPQVRKWFGPRYSLRRQADLVKKARACGEMHLLPDGPKKFAAVYRAENIRDICLSPAVVEQLAEVERQARAQTTHANKVEEGEQASGEKSVMDMEEKLKELTSTLRRLEESLKESISDVDLAECDVFEIEISDKVIPPDVVAEAEGKVEKLKAVKERIEKEIEEVQILFRQTYNELNSVDPSTAVHNWAWKAEVHWVPEFKKERKFGTSLGTTLYSGKKKMFKGHRWERERAEKLRKHAILMRDMPARIERYKKYYKKRKPHPLKPARYTKPPKLPY